MLKSLRWLAKKEEIEFGKIKYKGKLAGKSWKYSQNLDGLIRVRALIFLMSILVFYPVFTNAIFHNIFIPEFLIERVIYSIIFLAAGLLFNKFRIATIILSSIPLILILLDYLFGGGQFNLKQIAYTAAILILILYGIVYHFRLKKLRIELESNSIENQLIP